MACVRIKQRWFLDALCVSYVMLLGVFAAIHALLQPYLSDCECVLGHERDLPHISLIHS